MSIVRRRHASYCQALAGDFAPVERSCRATRLTKRPPHRLYSTGDSYVRHLHTALMMILRDRNDGAVRDYASTDDCRREQAFDDGKLCRDRINMDTNVEENVCGNAAQVAYRLM